MKFRYIGDDNDPPKQIEFMGQVAFTLGEVSEVTDPVICRKLTGNRLFESVADEPVFDKKEGLRYQLRQHGIVVDGRWGLDRLKQEAASLGY